MSQREGDRKGGYRILDLIRVCAASIRRQFVSWRDVVVVHRDAAAAAAVGRGGDVGKYRTLC